MSWVIAVEVDVNKDRKAALELQKKIPGLPYRQALAMARANEANRKTQAGPESPPPVSTPEPRKHFMESGYFVDEPDGSQRFVRTEEVFLDEVDLDTMVEEAERDIAAHHEATAADREATAYLASLDESSALLGLATDRGAFALDGMTSALNGVTAAHDAATAVTRGLDASRSVTALLDGVDAVGAAHEAMAIIRSFQRPSAAEEAINSMRDLQRMVNPLGELQDTLKALRFNPLKEIQDQQRLLRESLSPKWLREAMSPPALHRRFKPDASSDDDDDDDVT